MYATSEEDNPGVLLRLAHLRKKCSRGTHVGYLTDSMWNIKVTTEENKYGVPRSCRQTDLCKIGSCAFYSGLTTPLWGELIAPSTPTTLFIAQ